MLLALASSLVPLAASPSPTPYREVARFGSGLTRARGIAARGETLYVAGDKAIAVRRTDGTPIRSVPVSDAPVALAVAPEGTLYVAMQDHVEVYSAAGKRKARWAVPGRRAWFTSVAVTRDRVWVGDAGQRLLLGYDLSGRLVAQRGRRDAAAGTPGLLVPSPHLDVTAAGDGTLWAINPGRHRLEAYAPTGKLKRSWGRPGNDVEGFCGCCNPTDFAILPDGRFVTAEKGVPRVKLYGASGRFEGLLAGPEVFAQSGAGLDLAVDSRGRIAVLDRGSGAIRVYEKRQAHGR